MIPNISFGSTFKVVTTDNSKQLDAFEKFHNYSMDMYLSSKGMYGIVETPERKPNTEYVIEKGVSYTSTKGTPWSAKAILVVDDSLDSEVANYCKTNGIHFSQALKRDSKPWAINNRIQKAPKGFRRVFVNAEKLEKIAPKQQSNIPERKDIYDNFTKDNVDFMLKSGEEFPTTTLFIDYMGDGSVEGLAKYVRKNGIEHLNHNQLALDFDQMTDDFDQYAYFGFRDMGVKNIPVYMNDNSIKVASALGLLENGLK